MEASVVAPYLVKIVMDICVVDDRSNNNKRQHQAIAERRGESENSHDNNLMMYETQRVVCNGRLRVAMQNVELCDAWISKNTARAYLGTSNVLTCLHTRASDNANWRRVSTTAVARERNS